MRFDELRLAEPIVRAVAAEGYTTPTPIQAKAIPPALAGKDVLGCAQTGTGKTCAFALPILQRLAGLGSDRPARDRPRKTNRRPRALILCPTRELATQIDESFTAYGRNLGIRGTAIFGGVSQHAQVKELRRGAEVIVATPGRLLDLMGQKLIDLRGIEVLVLDEADRMLDMGFIRDIRKIIECLPKKRQTLLFSATMPTEIQRLADSLLHDPVFVKAAVVASTADAIEQSVYFVAKKDKPKLLSRLLSRESMGRTLVFTRTKYGADKLVKVLRKSGIDAAAIHGNKSQGARTRALAGFKSGKTLVLIATDIASRGIDVDEISHVINYDIPNIPETYVHRVGRTARAGASGIAVSFCDHEEVSDLRAIERLTDLKLTVAKDVPELVYEEPVRSRPSPRPKTAKTNSRRKRRPRSRRSGRSAV